MNREIIDDVRSRTPLVHHMTNQVVMNFSANGLLAFGGTPAMAKYIEVAADLAKAADALLVNIGTLARDDIPALIKAGKAANQKGIPVVFDPVGVGISAFNAEAAKLFLKEVRTAAIKGNAGELAFLVDIPWKTRGVDAIGSGDAEAVARQAAKTYDTVAVVTGETDILCKDGQVFQNTSGHPLLTKITGGGCLLGSIIAACLTTKHDALDQAYAAVHFYGKAAEYAALQNHVYGPGTFLPAFIDALSYDPDRLE